MGILKVTEREFLEHLHELNQKINFVKEQSFKESRSVQDIQGVLEKLRFKVRQSQPLILFLFSKVSPMTPTLMLMSFSKCSLEKTAIGHLEHSQTNHCLVMKFRKSGIEYSAKPDLL